MRFFATLVSAFCLFLALAGDAHAEVEPDPRLEAILDSAMTVPVYESGEFFGLKIDRIKQGRFFDLLGVEPGDVIVAYNGVRLNSVTETRELFDLLVSGKPYVLEIVRGGIDGTPAFVSGPPLPAA